MVHRRDQELRRWIGIAFLLLLSSLLGLGAVSLAEEKTAADFYRGATIRIIVPYAPGGIADTAARVATPFFEKYTGARVIVENMPGAGGYVALRLVYMAKPDGLTFGIIHQSGAFMAEVLGQKEATWKLQKMNHTGRILRGSGGIMMVGKQSSIHTLEDLLRTKREIKTATIDPTAGASINAALAAEGLGINLKIVPGFPGGRDCILAVMRGEIEMTINPPAGFAGDFEKGNLRAITIVAGREIAPLFQSLFSSVPRLIDLALSKDKKKFIDFADSLNEIGFVITGPPGIPKDRGQFLENALAKALREPEVIKVFERRGDAYAPLSGAEHSQLLRDTEKKVAEINVKDLNHILFEKYY